MAEEKIHNVNVVLRYAVTGSESAARKFLSGMHSAHSAHGGMETEHGADFAARFVCADVNPGEVEGYRNYETFSIAVWLKNDRKLYDKCREMATDSIRRSKETLEFNETLPELVMADWLEGFVKEKLWIDQREENASNDAERMFVSLARAAFDRVDWRELGEEWIQDAQEN